MTEFEYIDSHCHLTDLRIADEAAGILATSSGLIACIGGGYDPEDWQRQLALAQQSESTATTFYPTAGLHPYWIAQSSDENCRLAFATLEQHLPQVCALSETGLDLRPPYRDRRYEQLQWCERQLDLASSLTKPVVLHSVKAHNELLELLTTFHTQLPAIVIHGFTGSMTIASKYLDLGVHLSVGTRVLYNSAWRLREAVQHIPANMLLAESDAPDQPPPNSTHELNHPRNVALVIRHMAEIRGEPLGPFAAALVANAKRVFSIP